MFCLAAAVLFTACGPDAFDGDGNWWTRMNMATGVKSITEVSTYEGGSSTTTYEYDKAGKLVKLMDEWNEEVYTYNADGLIAKFVQTSKGAGGSNATYSRTYTYGDANKDRYLPRQVMGGGMPMHLDRAGLLPGLVKIETDSNGEKTVIEFSFKGDVLTIKGTGKNEWDNYETTCEYAGAYPNKAQNQYEFMGPITYYENGMIKSYREGFLDEEGAITTDRTTTYKNFENKLNLQEKMVEVFTGGGQTTVTRTYDKYGNLIKELNEYQDADSHNSEYLECSYEYDNKGMWTKMTSKWVNNNGQVYNQSTVTRTIVYY